MPDLTGQKETLKNTAPETMNRRSESSIPSGEPKPVRRIVKPLDDELGESRYGSVETLNH